jgi:hypothetical protein
MIKKIAQNSHYEHWGSNNVALMLHVTKPLLLGFELW